MSVNVTQYAFLDLISQQNVEKNSIQHWSRNNNLPKFCCVMFIFNFLATEKNFNVKTQVVL